MSVFRDLSSVFWPSGDRLSEEAKVKVQTHRVLSLFGTFIVPLFGLFYDIPFAGEIDSVLSRLAISAFFAGVLIASYASAHVRHYLAQWIHAGLYGTLAWTVLATTADQFGAEYTVGLLVVYATFLAVVGFGSKTITPVLWFAGIGILLTAGGIALSAPLRTSPYVLLAYMTTVAVAETLTIRGSLTSARQLEERDQQFRAAQRVAKLGYWSHDVQSGDLHCSPEARRIFGWSATAEVTPETFQEAVHPDDQERVRAALEAALADEDALDVQHRIRGAAGRERIVRERGVVHRDETGTPTTLIGAVLDVTEQKEIERALRRSEQRFRGLFEESALGIALLDHEGQLLEVNPALESMLGFESGALKGRHFEEFTHPDDVEKDKAFYRELTRGERTAYQLEKRYVRPDGEIIYGRLTVSSREGPEGIQVIGMVEDITAETKRKEQLRLFRKIVEQAHEGVVIVKDAPLEEAAPPIAYVNPAFTEMTGYDAEEAIGRPVTFLQGAETEPWVLERLRTRMEEGHVFEGEAINYRKDGHRFVNRWSIAPVRDEDGRVTHWVSVQRDVTEERQMGKRLLEVQEEERRRIDSEMHDQMGGILTALQLTIDGARVSAQDRGEVTEWLDQVVDLVDQLSGVARTISRRLHPGELEDHGLGPALHSLADQMKERRGLEVHLDMQRTSQDRYSTLVEMTAYRVVQEALVNVVAHAETTAAQVTVEEEDEHLRFQVTDHGVGFDLEKQTGQRTYGLHGMAKRVERLNGEITVQSEVGEGTRISATLPLGVAYVPT